MIAIRALPVSGKTGGPIGLKLKQDQSHTQK
jgi:hypothetical protein